MTNKNQTLGEFIIENQKSHQYSSGELSSLINSIRLAAKVVNFQVNKAGLVDIIGDSNTINTQGEEQLAVVYSGLRLYHPTRVSAAGHYPLPHRYLVHSKALAVALQRSSRYDDG